MLDQADRMAFSLEMVTIAKKLAGITASQAVIQSSIDAVQALDTANKNLFDPVNAQVNLYQPELSYITGNVRTTIVEQDLVDSTNRLLGNHFFPNQTSVTVPSLSGSNNVWLRYKPYALTYAVGKNYGESYATITGEDQLISQILGYISSAASYTDIQNTTGQHCVSGTCSLPGYYDSTSCTSNGGTWTPSADTIVSYPEVQALKSNLAAAVNSLVSILNSELAAIPTGDTDPTRQAQNNAAIANITGVILPALTAWLAYPDFNTATGASSCPSFNGYNPAALAPTKLYSVDLSALQAAINARAAFVATRTSQLNTFLGSVTQDITTGLITASSGVYGTRYSFLSLRIDTLTGSLMRLTGLTNQKAQQTALGNDLQDEVAIYSTLLSVSSLSASASGTSTIHVVTPSLFSVGDTVYVMADKQQELLRAIRSISGNTIVLNDIVPQKYSPQVNGRIYKLLG